MILPNNRFLTQLSYIALAVYFANSRGPVGHDVLEPEDALSGEVVEEDDVDRPLPRLVVRHQRELDAAKVARQHHRLNEVRGVNCTTYYITFHITDSLHSPLSPSLHCQKQSTKLLQFQFS